MQHTILLVDDEVESLEVLKSLLEKEGYQILTATSGKEGLQILKDNLVDLIISDQRMPEMSGIEFLQEVKRRYPETIRIILTAYFEDSEVAIEAINKGEVYRFIKKPWKAEEMRVIIKDTLYYYDLTQENKRLYQVIESQNKKLQELALDLEKRVKERTRELKEAKDYLENLLENANDIIYTLDPKGNFTYINQRIKEWGYQKDELLGQPFLSILAETRQKEGLAGFLKKGKRQIYEVKLKDKEGNIKNAVISSSPLKDSKGKITGTLEIARDITERRRAEEEIRRLQQYNQIILTAIPSGVALYDRNLKTLYINDRFTEIFELEKKDVTGKNPLEYLPPSALETMRLREKLAKLRNKGNTLSSEEIPYVKPNGEKMILDFRMYPLLDREGKAEYLLAVVDDLTERKKLEQEIVRIEKLTSTSELAAGVAHEVRNPLSIVSGAAQYLHKLLGPNSSYREYTEAIIKNTEAVEAIIGDLLDFTRPLPIPLKARDLHQCLDKTLKFLQKKCLEQKVQLVKKYDPKASLVRLDEQHLGQVFLNLALNALQAMPQGGKLAVSTKHYPEREQVTIKFSDTGQGIPEENLTKIFAPFFSTRSKGIGLGLSMSQKIVEAHEGSLTVESSLGKGATFTILLPARGT